MCGNVNVKKRLFSRRIMAESLAHRYAKQTLASWLRARSRVGANFKGLQPVLPHIPLSTDKPMYGVYEEYPVCRAEKLSSRQIGLTCDMNVGTVASTTDWHAWAAQHGKIASKSHGIPSKKDIKQWNDARKRSDRTRITSAQYFDIGIVSNGRLSVVFEIQHTHPSTPEKIAWLEHERVTWFEISADWILNRCSAPFSIEGAILKPWNEVKCKVCGGVEGDIFPSSKLGRKLCSKCVTNHRFCSHPDCSDFTVDFLVTSRRCKIHARLDMGEALPH